MAEGEGEDEESDGNCDYGFVYEHDEKDSEEEAMSENKEAVVDSDIIFVQLEFHTKTKAFGIKSNAPDPVYQMGMLAFASAQVGRPKESAIKPAAAIPAGLPVPGHS